MYKFSQKLSNKVMIYNVIKPMAFSPLGGPECPHKKK